MPAVFSLQQPYSGLTYTTPENLVKKARIEFQENRQDCKSQENEMIPAVIPETEEKKHREHEEGRERVPTYEESATFFRANPTLEKLLESVFKLA